jgi:transcriptional regulator with XRE-family HTH domain
MNFTNAQHLRLHRRRLGQTQADLARRCGLTQGTYSWMESGRRTISSVAWGKIMGLTDIPKPGDRFMASMFSKPHWALIKRFNDKGEQIGLDHFVCTKTDKTHVYFKCLGQEIKLRMSQWNFEID